MSSYYRTKSPACLDETLAKFRQMPPTSRADAIVGFLAQLFRDSPAERERILKSEPSEHVRQYELFSLYEAGLVNEAEKFAAANNLSGFAEKMRSSPIVLLEDIRPSSVPGDNDLLIGAYMASGDTVFIQRILDNFSSADDSMASDALRIWLMKGKFGPTLAPKGRNPVIMQAACERYQCKKDQKSLLHVLTLSSAIWALQSLSDRDDGIKKTLSNFFERDSRLKAIFATEQTAFGNYVTALAVLTTLKDGQGEDQQRAYAAMNKSASIYENLGSPSDAFAPMTELKK